MKKRNQIIAAFLAATMIITPATSIFAKAAKDGSSSAESSYGESFTSWRTNEWENKLSKDWTTVSMTPGVNESTMNFAWYSKTTDTVSLTYGLKADLSDGKTVQITTKGTEQKDKDGNEYNSNKATISGLAAQTTYYYKVDDKEIKSFKTGNTGKFRFAFVGDPQIGSSNELKGSDTEAFYNAQSNAVANDSYNWTQTLKKIQSAGTDFIVSAGDQIQTTKKKAPGKSSTTSEIEYAGYLSPDTLASLPVATTVGNHDADNANYQYHFNVPNLSNLGDNGKVGGDYYFTYGDVLFMMLNTQDTNSAEHIQFIEKTVAKNANCKWKVVTLHQDIYGSAEHSNEPEIVNLRYALTPTFEKYGVDAVLTGHDHAYSRSKFLSGNQTEKTVTYTDDEFDEMLDKDIDYTGEGTLTVAPGNIKADTTDESEKTYLSYLTSVMDADRITETGEYVVDPKGILYLTASSSSGSKYYDLVSRQQSYIASRWQEDVPTYSLIDVTETTMTINTYRTDNDSAIDNTVTIVKSADKSAVDAKLAQINKELTDNTLVEKDYTTGSWKALKDAMDAANRISPETEQAQINKILENLTTARNGLVKVAAQEPPKPSEQSTEKTSESEKAPEQPTEKTSESEKASEKDAKKTSEKSNNKSASKVKTGDESQALLWTIVCVIGLGAAGTAVVFAGKERK